MFIGYYIQNTGSEDPKPWGFAEESKDEVIKLLDQSLLDYKIFDTERSCELDKNFNEVKPPQRSFNTEELQLIVEALRQFKEKQETINSHDYFIDQDEYKRNEERYINKCKVFYKAKSIYQNELHWQIY